MPPQVPQRPSLSVAGVVAVGIGAIIFYVGGAMYQPIAAVFLQNEFLQAMMVPSALGFVVYVLNMGLNMLQQKFREHYFSQITMSNKDPNYEPVLGFITKQCSIHTGSLLAQTSKKKKKTWKEWREEFLMGRRKAPTMEYRPNNDSDAHLIRYADRRIMLRRVKGDTVTIGWNRKPLQLETLTLSMWGTDNSTLKQLLDDAITSNFEEENNEINIYVYSSDWGGWERALSKKPRSAESVILDERLSVELLHDAKEFLESAEWYSATGIPYRRGYLLYGPPGCGKTSTAEVLAGELKLDICQVSLSAKDLDDTRLASSLLDAPKRGIVLLEDVDAVFVERSVNTASTPSSGVTFSGLLNALDGVASQEGRILIMTTNHMERLDPALIRPGRCDVKVELRRASHSQMRLLFLRFFPEEHDLASTFAERLPENEISMAQLQGHLLESKRDPRQVVDRIPKLLLSIRPQLSLDTLTVYDHLKRVGLQQFAAVFEYHGYAWRADLEGLTVDTVRQWDASLKYLPNQSVRRLTALFAGEEWVTKLYRLADHSQIKDQYFLTYHASEASDDMLSRSSSGLAVMSSSDLETDAAAEEHILELCSFLTKGGKGLVSVYAVGHHMDIWRDASPNAAVSAAAALVEERSVQDKVFRGTSTWQMLRWVCMEHHYEAFIHKGYPMAKDWEDLNKESLQKLGLTDEEATLMSCVLTQEAKRSDILGSVQVVDTIRIREEFMIGFPEAPKSLAQEFATSLTDIWGNSTVSLRQLHRFLRACPSPTEAVSTASTLLAAAPVVSPVARTTWVEEWLSELGLSEYSSSFLAQGITTMSDILEPTPFTDNELGACGVTLQGHMRQLLKAVKVLEEKHKPKEKEEPKKE